MGKYDRSIPLLAVRRVQGGNNVRTGLIAAAIVIGLLMGISLLADAFGTIFTIIAVILGGMVFAVGTAIAIAVRVIKAGVRTVRRILDVDDDERYAGSAEMAREQASLDHVTGELEEAAERVRHIYKAAHTLRAPALSVALERIARTGRALVLQAAESPVAARRLRKSLRHHLEHVEAVALAMIKAQEAGSLDHEMVQRASQTLSAVAEDFAQKRWETGRARLLDAEARLTLLDQSVGDRPAATRQYGTARS